MFIYVYIYICMYVNGVIIIVCSENAVNIWKKIGAAVLGGDEIGMVGLLEVK